MAQEDGHSLDATHLNWKHDLRLDDPEQGWVCRMPGSTVRVFAPGTSERFSGLIEVRRLPQGSEFYLACSSEARALIEKWGQTACTQWSEVPISSGLPTGWQMYHAGQVLNDNLVKNHFAVLSLDSGVRLSLRGGVRASRSDCFFDFAPPRIQLQGGAGVEVHCFTGEGDQRPSILLERGVGDLYELPAAVLEHSKIEVQAREGDKDLARRSFFLVRDGWEWRGDGAGRWSGPFGEPHAGQPEGEICDSECALGAMVRGVSAPPFQFNGLVPLPDKGTIHYIGQEPGQIAHWTEAPSWSPVWVVTARRQGQAVFCGTSVDEAQPQATRCTDKRLLKQWKELLWVHRKKIDAPAHPAHKALWQKYQEVARNA